MGLPEWEKKKIKEARETVAWKKNVGGFASDIRRKSKSQIEKDMRDKMLGKW